MKLIIDIEKDYFEMIKYNVACGEKYKPFEIIADGTPYEARPKGEWIYKGTEEGAMGIQFVIKQCNKCGFEHSLVIPKNFCPNCGADMRGKEE